MERINHFKIHTRLINSDSNVMTLIIAGHNTLKDGFSKAWTGKTTVRTDGLFAVADSVITTHGSSGDKPILSGLRKIHHIPIKLWKPYFIDTDFRDYYEVYLETGCFVAFAGSTLTATHALNLIVEHLSKLQISYTSLGESTSPGEYIVQRHCEYNYLRDYPGVIQWDYDMFQPKDFVGLLSGEYISMVIEHSINKALASAKKYRLTREDLNLMRTDFVAGVYCPRNETHHLYVYNMRERINQAGLIEVFTEREEISEHKVVVLGLKKEFEQRAQTTYEQSIHNMQPAGDELFKFLNSAIDEISKSGSFSIDRPALHKKFYRGTLEKIDIALPDES